MELFFVWTNEGGITLRRPFWASLFGFQKYRLEHLKAKKTAVNTLLESSLMSTIKQKERLYD